MKFWIKSTAVLLAAVIIISGLLGGSMVNLSAENILSAPQPTTAPTTEPTTAPTTIPTTAPTTVPTEPTTAPTTGPTQPATPPVVNPPEPWSSTDITVGTPVPGVTAKKAFVYDCGSKDFLYMKSEPDAKLYPASIAKLMNAYTALKILSTDAVLTMGADISALVPIDTSKAYLYNGDRLTFENALKAMLVPSGSDAAHLIAVSAGRVMTNNHSLPAQEAENVFVEEMNRQAAGLGLVNTHFVNCDGYSDYYHYSCMADLVTIATVCLDTPVIRDTVCSGSVTLHYADGRSRTLISTNYLLNTNSVYYRPDARGLKTGTTNAAGACLLAAFWVNGRYLLVGVFQCYDNNARYSSAVKLFDTYSGYVPPAPPPPPATEPSTEPTEDTTVPTEPTETTAPTDSTDPTDTTDPTEPSTEVTEPTEESTEATTETSLPETTE